MKAIEVIHLRTAKIYSHKKLYPHPHPGRSISRKFVVFLPGPVQEINVKSLYFPLYCSVKSLLSAGVWGSGLQLTSALLTIAFFTEIISIFLCRCPHTYSLSVMSVLDSGLFQNLHSNKILFSGRGWIFSFHIVVLG